MKDPSVMPARSAVPMTSNRQPVGVEPVSDASADISSDESSNELSDASSSVTVLQRAATSDRIRCVSIEARMSDLEKKFTQDRNVTDNKFAALEAKLDCLTSKVQEVVNVAKRTEANIRNEVSQLENSVNIVTGRFRNVLLLNIPEVRLASVRQRRCREVAFVHSVFRAARLPLGTRWKRVHRVGRWCENCLLSPRPLLVELHQQDVRDILLSRRLVIQQALGGSLMIVPDTPKWASGTPSRHTLMPNPVVQLHRLPVVPCNERTSIQARPTIDKPVARAAPSSYWTPGSATRTYSEVVAGTEPRRCLTISKGVQTATVRNQQPSKNGLVPRRARSRDE